MPHIPARAGWGYNLSGTLFLGMIFLLKTIPPYTFLARAISLSNRLPHVEIQEIPARVAGEIGSEKPTVAQVSKWILENRAIADLLSSIEEDEVFGIPLKKTYARMRFCKQKYLV